MQNITMGSKGRYASLRAPEPRRYVAEVNVRYRSSILSWLSILSMLWRAQSVGKYRILTASILELC